MMLRMMGLLVAAFCLVSTVRAAEAPRVWVVAVGVAKYDQPFNQLSYASAGAQKVAKALADAQPLVTKTTVLTTDSSDRSVLPTGTNVARHVGMLAQKVKPEDLVIFYFCGHGIEIDKQQYLLMADADLTDSDTLDRSTVRLSWLRDKLDALPCNGRLLLLDACRETPESLRVTGGAAESAAVTRDFLVSGGGWQSRPDRVSATMFGCREGQKVYHGRSGSFFTEKLVEGISGRAADESGKVTLASLTGYVRKTVPEAVSDELGARVIQEPVLMPEVAPEVVLRPSPGYIACLAFAGEWGDLFAETVQTRLSASADLHLVERSRISDALKELKLQDTALTDPKTAGKLGTLLNAKYVLVGSSKPGPDGNLHVYARLVEVATGRDVPGVAAKCTAEKSGWQPAVDSLACELLNRMRGVVRPEEVPVVRPAPVEPPKPKIEPSKPQVITPSPSVDTSAAKGAAGSNAKDGSQMILIPAGEFTMGSYDGLDKPAHKVCLDGYEIGKYEVTVSQYRKFCSATGREMSEAPEWGWKDDHPIVNVTWDDARAYCKWAGGRLPSEAEWEKAARGTAGRQFPWGNTWDKNKCANIELGLHSTVSVGSYPSGASPYGCMDMAGNVWEWCKDWYGESYYSHSPANNPQGPASGSYHVARGGGWIDFNSFCRCVYRGHEVVYSYNGSSFGFRLAR